MTREEILKLLASLGIKVTADGADGTMKEDDAVKLVEDQFKASNLGLIQNRDSLLAENKTQKDKITALETAATDLIKKISDLDSQLKKNDPEARKIHYENELAKEKAKFEQDLVSVTADRDKYRDSHYARIKEEAINDALQKIDFVDGLRDGFVSLAMMRNKFDVIEVDGKTQFINQDKKDIGAVLHELSLSKEGKHYIKNGKLIISIERGNP